MPKELSLNKRWNRKSYLYVKRVKEEELTSNMPVILDVAVDLNINNELPPHILKDIEKEEEKEEKTKYLTAINKRST